MMFAVLLEAANCSTDEDCHFGTCSKLKKTCTCDDHHEGDYCDECSAEYIGEDCKECADGFLPIVEMGNDRCVNEACINNSVSCNNNGECYLKNKQWECRCANHYEGKNSMCTKCEKNYYEIAGEVSKRCVSKYCLNDDHTVECSNFGSCIQIIDNIIVRPRCYCASRHMTSLCDSCQEGYIVDTEKECRQDYCGTDMKCSDNGECGYNNYTERFECECKDFYDLDTQCSSCLGGFSLESGCTECQSEKYDPLAICSECIFGYSLESGCEECLNNFDIESNCTKCEEGYSLATECAECLRNYTLNSDGECILSYSSNDIAWIVFGVIASVVLVLLMVCLLVIYLRRQNQKKFEQTAQDEQDVLLENIG